MVSAVQTEAEVEAVELTSHGFSSLCSAPPYEEQENLTLPVRLDAVFFMELDSSFIAIKIDQEAHARTLPKSKKVMGP